MQYLSLVFSSCLSVCLFDE